MELKATHITSWIIAIHFSSALLCPSGFFPCGMCVQLIGALLYTLRLYCSDRICAIEAMPHHICKFIDIFTAKIYSKSCELSHSALPIQLSKWKERQKTKRSNSQNVDTLLIRANFISIFFCDNLFAWNRAKCFAIEIVIVDALIVHILTAAKTGMNCNFWHFWLKHTLQ